MSLEQSKRRILVVCPTAWERTAIVAPALQEHYAFTLCGEELYDHPSFFEALRFDVKHYLDKLVAQHRDRGISGVLATGDYPGCMFGAFIAEQLGLPSPSPRAAVLLSHKYYSRELQRRHVPEATPRFEALIPRLLGTARSPKTLPYPFFIKPMKGTMSIRAQQVHTPQDLRRGLAFSLRDYVRARLLLLPFAQLLRMYVGDPIPAHAFIAEEMLSGHQVTVDGFVQNGRATVMGIVDSIMYPGTMSFRRFEYPSSLPSEVQTRMSRIAIRLMQGAEFDHSCFNIEMFYNAERDAISIIEINPRMSYQFSDLYERVDGMSSFSIQLALATGAPVQWRPGQGLERVAASFVMRRFTDARVLTVPTQRELAEVEQRFPGTHVKALCAPGERLSDHDQDLGSYRYCIVNMAAPSVSALHARYAEAESILRFTFA